MFQNVAYRPTVYKTGVNTTIFGNKSVKYDMNQVALRLSRASAIFVYDLQHAIMYNTQS